MTYLENWVCFFYSVSLLRFFSNFSAFFTLFFKLRRLVRGNSSSRFGGGDVGAADGADDLDSTLVVTVEGADGGWGAVNKRD